MSPLLKPPPKRYLSPRGKLVPLPPGTPRFRVLSRISPSRVAAAAKGRRLNKKALKARILHLEAKPGDHFFAKVKGYPPWPAIVCDEGMLPDTLLKSRPVTAAREDGTYREDYANGGKREGDRTFPVMYLSTNEL